MLQHVQSDIIHISVHWKRGVGYFFHPDGGGVMQFYHLGIGGGQHFFLTPRHCLPPPPPLLKFMNSPLLSAAQTHQPHNSLG